MKKVIKKPIKKQPAIDPAAIMAKSLPDFEYLRKTLAPAMETLQLFAKQASSLLPDLRPLLALRKEYELKVQNIISSIKPYDNYENMVMVAPPRQITKADIRNIFDEAVAEIKEQNKHREMRIILVLSKSGILCLKEQPLKKYEMEKSKLRLDIVRFLKNKQPNFIETPDLRTEVGGKSIGSIQDAIKFINQNTKKQLGLIENLIQGQRGSGYRINPKYIIEHTY